MTTSATPVPTKTRRQQRRRSRRLSPPLTPLRGTNDRSGKRRSPAPDGAKEWEDRIREDFANHLKAKGIGSWKLFLFTVMRFLTEANVWPWSADRNDYEAWLAGVGGQIGSKRQYHQHVKKFSAWLFDDRNGWASECRRRFRWQIQVFADGENGPRHNGAAEKAHRPRALSDPEVGRLRAALGAAEAEFRRRRCKGVNTVIRDRAILALALFWGLRRSEIAKLRLRDFAPNPRHSEFGRFGVLTVIEGKGHKDRLVWTVSAQGIPDITRYLNEVRPKDARKYDGGADIEDQPLFLSERGTRLSLDAVGALYPKYGGAAAPGTSLHGLRHTYATRLMGLSDMDPRFVQEQLGHEYLQTTTGYIKLQPAELNRVLAKLLRSSPEGSMLFLAPLDDKTGPDGEGGGR